MIIKWLICKGYESEFSHPWQRWYVTRTLRDKCTQVVYNFFNLHKLKIQLFINIILISVTNNKMSKYAAYEQDVIGNDGP
jgi:pantothenate kinase type III